MSDSLARVASAGDRLKTLEALRDRIAEEIDRTRSARDVAALSRQLTDVLAQIEEINPATEEEDDLAALIALPGAG